MEIAPFSDLNLRKAGIYLILNSINDKAFIGSSSCLYSGIGTTLKELYALEHKNRAFQLDWSKMGSPKFNIYILEVFDEDFSRGLLMRAQGSWKQTLSEKFSLYAHHENFNHHLLTRRERRWEIEKLLSGGSPSNEQSDLDLPNPDSYSTDSSLEFGEERDKYGFKVKGLQSYREEFSRLSMGED